MRGQCPHRALGVGEDADMSSPPTDPQRTPHALRRVGAEALERGDVAEARRCFAAALAQKPNLTPARAGLARCDEADEAWESAASNWKVICDEHAGDERFRGHQRRYLRALYLAGRFDEARTALADSWQDTEARRAYWNVITNVADGTQDQLQYRHVLVVTYGRTGSTLLQGVLNSINGLVVRGENGNVFRHLYEMVADLREHALHGTAWTPDTPWFGFHEMAADLTLDRLRPLARGMLLGSDADNPAVYAVGFKEIRYLDMRDDLEEYLDFLAELFPETAFIFNTRKATDTRKSGWWAGEPEDEVIEQFVELERRFDRYASTHDHCFQITYEDVVEMNDRLRELFTFLGAAYDPSRLEAVLAISHSYANNRDAETEG